MATTETEAKETVRWIGLPGGGPKPSAACSDDDTRPSLMHGYLRRRDDGLWLYVTTSYIAVGLRVSGEADEGWVPRRVLEAMEEGEQVEQISATAWRVPSDHGRITHDVALHVHAAKFPHLDTFLHDDLTFEALEGIALDPKWLSRVNDALGYPPMGTSLRFTGAHRLIRVQKTGQTDRVGVLMPLRENA